MEKQRLDRFISNQTGTSRSVVKNAIRYGYAFVDGVRTRDPSVQIYPEKSVVEYYHKRIDYKKHLYIIMNKPEGVLSASEDKNRTTVVDLVPEELRRNTLFPVGRLDRDTTGLLIITDDGDFAHNCISPSKNIEKKYSVVLNGDVDDGIIQKFADGVILADGTPCRPAHLVRTGENRADIVITEGRYHQVKRMFGTVGLGVEKLKRLSVGKLQLPSDLNEGECREMTESEISDALK